MQRTYEAVLGRAVDTNAFRTRMLAAGFLDEAGVIEAGSNRPPMGYRLCDRTQAVVSPRTFSRRPAAPCTVATSRGSRTAATPQRP